MFEKLLTQLGLSEKEAHVYVILLKNDRLTAAEISSKSKINRSTVYVVLESLIKSGLVGIVQSIQPVKRYRAASPEVFMRGAQQRFSEAEKTLKATNELVPKLTSLHQETRERPEIEIFEGLNGFINAVEKMLNNAEKKYRLITSADKLMTLVPEYIAEFAQRRIKNGVHLYVIVPDTKHGHAFMDTGTRHYTVKYLKDLENEIFSTEVAIFDNSIGYMFFVDNKPLVIIIKSPDMVATMKGLFDLAMGEPDESVD